MAGIENEFELRKGADERAMVEPENADVVGLRKWAGKGFL